MESPTALALLTGLLIGYLAALPLFALAGLASLQYFYHAYDSTPSQLRRFLATLKFPFSLYRGRYWQQMYGVFDNARSWYIARTALLIVTFWASAGWAAFTVVNSEEPLDNRLIAAGFILFYAITSAVVISFGRRLLRA
mgnify:CR=1 FL=1